MDRNAFRAWLDRSFAAWAWNDADEVAAPYGRATSDEGVTARIQ